MKKPYQIWRTPPFINKLTKLGALLGLLSATATPALAQAPAGFELVWSDEFSGSAVDTTKWSFMYGDGSEYGNPGWGNNELQYYRAENATVDGGTLTITAKQENFGGREYTSTRLRSMGKGDFTYGRFEMRAKLPIGKGLWPAFWMLPTNSPYGGWAASGEIDIMEYIGSQPTKAFGTIHYGAPWPNNVYSGGDYFLPAGAGTFADDFHTFAIEWEPEEMRWYVDGHLFSTKTNWFSTAGPYPAPFDVNFHMLLNLAVGGNLPGNPDGTATFPQQYVVDYVRVYQKPNNPPTIVLTSPTEGATVTPGSPVTLTAQVTDDGAIRKVEFYHQNIKLGEDTLAPYELTIANPQAGCYTVKAKVKDDGGVSAWSAPVNFSVGSGCPQSPYGIAAIDLPGVVEAENFDQGGEGVAYHDVDSTNNGGQYRPTERVDIESTGDAGGGFNLGYVEANEWLEYTVNVTTAGTYDLEFRVSSGAAGGSFRAELNGVDKTGPLSVAATGGWQNWTTVKAKGIALDAGVQTLRFVSVSGGFNLNKITVKEPVPSTPGKSVVFDDMEHGNPLANGWFSFGGAVGGGGLNVNTTVPPQDGGQFSIETGWGSGGTPGWFGGFGRTSPTDIGGTTHFTFWINPDQLDGAGRTQNYTLELNLQDDDNGDGNIAQADDDEFQYNLKVGPQGSDAEVIVGRGWQKVSIPLSSFFDDGSYLYGGNGQLDAVSGSNGGNGQLINVVFSVISTGADVSFRTDYWAFTAPEELPTLSVFDDFEDNNTADWGWFGGNEAGGGGGPFSDRAKQGQYYLSTGWGGQGTASTFYGGFYKNLPEDAQLKMPQDPWINIWVLNQSNATVDEYTMEVTVREDTDGDGYNQGADDSFRLDTKYVKSQFDDRWTLLSAPLSQFMNMNTGGDGVFNGKLDEVVVVVSGVKGAAGTAVELDLDYIAFTKGGPLVKDTLAPSFTLCPANIGPLNSNGNDSLAVSWSASTATDDISTLLIAQVAGPASGSAFAAGSTTTITYEATDAQGNTSTCSFTVTVAPKQDIEQITGFTLINSANDQAIQTLSEGTMLNLNNLPSTLNVQVLTSKAGAGSVKLEFRGRTWIENVAPYSIAGDWNGNFNALSPALAPGEYTLTATSYENDNAQGAVGNSVTIHFRVVRGPFVSSFTLINSATDADIATLTDGDTLDLASLPATLNIRANTSEPAKQVVFSFRGKNITEKTAPYALGGDSNGNYNALSPALSPGTYTLKGVAYREVNGQLQAGTSYSIQLLIINSASAARVGLEEVAEAEISARPNPFSEQATINFRVNDPSQVHLQVINQLGQPLEVLYNGKAEPNVTHRAEWRPKGLPNGLYFYQFRVNGKLKVGKLILEK